VGRSFQRQIEMSWVCSACGTSNLGRYQRCQNCNDPKDRSEKYVMPGDTAAAPTITDAALLKMAEAGKNWTCAYCGSHQRRLDGSCQQCGASIAQALADIDKPEAQRKRPLWQRIKPWVKKHKIAVGVASAVLLIILIVMWSRREREYKAVVDGASWTQTISVERYQIWSRDGWRDSTPSGAFDVVSRGQQIHHYDSVLDGYDTQYYTEQVACGQECRDVPESCHESCSDNGNGFATCTTRCTGGGQTCSTKYCSEQRSRQVPRYRQEPRYAEGIAYKIWDWGFHRKVDATGTDFKTLRWPTEEARLGLGLVDPREKERESRSGTYDVTLRYDDKEKLRFSVSLDELPKFENGTKHDLKIKGDRVVVDGKVVQRAVGP
jgi:hypothetical protein